MKSVSRPSSTSVPFISTRRPMSRRHFLRGSGVVLSLPFLDAMLPTLGRAQQSNSELAADGKPRRMIGVINNLGFVNRNFFPSGAGFDYTASPYLNLLKDHRKDLTVFTGVSLPHVDGSHPTQACFLTGAPHPGATSFRNTVSLDQVIAERVGPQTRFPSLALGINTRSNSLSYTGTGVGIPPEDKASTVFKQFFVQGTEAEVQAQVVKLRTGRSILDTVGDMAKDMERDLGTADRERIDQYFTSVRSLETRLQASEGWELKPKPVVHVPVPVDPANPSQYIERIKVMYDLAKLAFQNDSTRVITIFTDSAGTPVVDSPLDIPIREGYHNLSHHGKSEAKLSQLEALDVGVFKSLNSFMGGLKGISEDGENLLDRTMILFGSNFYDGNSHLTTNMPIIFAGGGFKHGQHLVFDTERNYPLTNLHLSMLHRMGIKQGKFSTSTGTMRGLEMT